MGWFSIRRCDNHSPGKTQKSTILFISLERIVTWLQAYSLESWFSLSTSWNSVALFRSSLLREDGQASFQEYELKVVAINSWISCYVNNTLVASTGDYILQASDQGQSTFLANGYFGLQNSNGEVVFQDARVIPINDENMPILSDIGVISKEMVQ